MAVIEGATSKHLDISNASKGEDDNHESANQSGADDALWYRAATFVSCADN